MQLSIIIPVLNEETNIEQVLHTLAPLRRKGSEVIVVDGGSSDQTASLAAPLADYVIHAERGRANQMNAGAAVSNGEVLLFLHADTVVPANAFELIEQAIVTDKGKWGRFDVRIDGKSPMFRVIAYLMNTRSRLTGIATGDQSIFVQRDAFFSIGGFPGQPLMEDIELSARLKQYSAPICLRERVTTSGRRWEQKGVWWTIFLMWRLRLLYWLGAAPEKLAQAYR